MRDYGKLSPTFWTRGPGRKLRGDHLAIAIAAYVHTCPASNMIGLYYLALPSLCHEIGARLEDVRATLAKLAELDVVHFDEETDLVWVPDGAAEQTGPTLKPADNRHKAVRRELSALGSHRFVTAFWNRYGVPYHLGEAPSEAPPQAPSVAPTQDPSNGVVEPLRSQKQKQLQDQKQDQEHAHARDSLRDPIVVPEAYAFAFARGVERGAACPILPPRSSFDLQRFVAIVDVHARAAGVGSDAGVACAWIERVAEDFARAADSFVRTRGFKLTDFEGWLNGRNAARPGVQPAASGQSWTDRNPNRITAAGAAPKGPTNG